MTGAERIKLTAYFGERDRSGGRFVADRLMDLCEERAVHASMIVRGIESFGTVRQLHTQRLLTLSEELPLVAVAVDEERRMLDLLPVIREVMPAGLITLERARLKDSTIPTGDGLEISSTGAKLTIFCGRLERVDGVSAVGAVVNLLHEEGVAGATAVLGVDGTIRGARRRARFFAANVDVPVAIESVGDAPSIERTLRRLERVLPRSLAIVERVLICKRDGVKLVTTPEFVDADDDGTRFWHKLSVYAGEQARHANRPLYSELIGRLRREGASGATAVRGFWGYHGDHAPHGDVLLSLRRRVPVVTTMIDTAERSARWFAIVDEMTDETGLVTSETVPAFHAFGAEFGRGGTTLASRTR